MRGQKKLARSEASPATLVGLAAMIAVASALAGLYTLPGTRIPLLNPVPAVCLAAMLVYGLRTWPAVLAGSVVWSAVMLAPDYVLAAAYSLGITLASVMAAWGVFRYWRLDLSRNAVHNLMVVYLFGAVAFAAVMMLLVAPAITGTRHAAPAEALLLTLWLPPYIVLGIAAFLPAIMLVVLKLPPEPASRSQSQRFVTLGRRGWILGCLLLALIHFWLLAVGHPEFAISLRYLLLLMIIVAALRFGYRFNAVASLAVVAYLVLAESWWLGPLAPAVELPKMIDLNLVCILALLAAQLIAMYRLESATATVDIRRHASHDATTGLLF